MIDVFFDGEVAVENEVYMDVDYIEVVRGFGEVCGADDNHV